MSLQLQIIPMANANELLFGQAWELYEEAFPTMERREEQLHRCLLAHPQFRAGLYIQHGQVVGLLFWWQFTRICFIEHLAISRELRGSGLGARLLTAFLSETDSPVVLEVELPNDEIARRRIVFYERLGFKLNPFVYRQLPMQIGGDEVDMLLLSYPNLLTPDEFEDYKREFRSTCFDPYLKAYFPDI